MGANAGNSTSLTGEAGLTPEVIPLNLGLAFEINDGFNALPMPKCTYFVHFKKNMLISIYLIIRYF